MYTALDGSQSNTGEELHHSVDAHLIPFDVYLLLDA
jgi:hypothetical protein